MQLMTYGEWVAALRAHAIEARSERRESSRSGPACIGIDGPGGSGKSTIARQLALAAPDFQVIALDDFYRPSRERYAGPIAQRPVAADYDLERLRREVLEPLASGRPAVYRRYDWETDAVGTERVTVAKPSVVLEGIYSSSATLAPFLDATIWIECPRELRLARGLARDGEPARARWELDWMPGEDRYLQKERPRERASFVCDGGRDDLSARIALLQQR